jgi:N-ethylmaleimide reductase
MSNQPLFTPYRMGDLDLPNRIVMAPLTRMRAQPHNHVPTELLDCDFFELYSSSQGQRS